MSEMLLIDPDLTAGIQQAARQGGFPVHSRHTPRGMQVDEVHHLRGAKGAMRMKVVEDEVVGGGKE